MNKLIALRQNVAVAATSLFVAAAGPSAADESAWAALKQGGKVVLMRHAHMEQGEGKPSPLVRDPSCAKERNLSEQGRKQAAQIGKEFRRRAIPVGEVLASPYCRNMDTAKIAFGEATAADFLSLGLSWEERTKKAEEASTRIGAYKGSQNLVMITQLPNIQAITLGMTLEEGAFLVLRPTREGRFDVLGKIALSGD